MSHTLRFTRSGSARLFAAAMAASFGAQAQETGASSEAVDLDTITITASGLTRTVDTITAEEMEYQAAGVIPQAFLNSVPGVNIQMTDPYGQYEFGNSIRIRGFTSEQLALTLDDVPIEETPDTRDATPPNRLMDTENMSEIAVAQGSGDVTTPSFHALGGSVRYYTKAPVGKWAATVSQTAGANQMNRTFVRVDTPELWSGGPIAYVSGSRQSSQQFQNEMASMRMEHFSAMVKQDLDMGSISFSYKYGNRDDHDIDAYNLDGTKSYTFSQNITGIQSQDALFYDNWLNGRKDEQFSLNGKFQLTDALSMKVVPYYEHKDGYGTAGVPYDDALQYYNEATNPDLGGVAGRTDVAPPNDGRFTKRLETMGGDRWGLVTGLTLALGNHEIQLGGWYQDYHFKQVRPLFNLDAEGNFDTSVAPITVYYDRDSQTEVMQYYLQDTISLFDARMTLVLGAKALSTERTGKGYVDRTAFNALDYSDVTRKDEDFFQPQVGLAYKLTSYEEVFANYAENYSALPRLALFSSGYNPDVEAESSTNIDVGIRSERGPFSTSLSLYYVDYQDRVLSIAATTGAEGLFNVGESIYTNVGSIETKGIELAGYWTPSDSFRAGAALTLNSSEFQDDYVNGLVTDEDGNYLNEEGEIVTEPEDAAPIIIPAAGKTVPDVPEVMLSLSGTYYLNDFYFGLDSKFTGERQSTTINSESTDSYTIVNGSVGYIAGDAGVLKNLSIQANVYNMLDEDYFGVIYYGESAAEYAIGAPRQLFDTFTAQLYFRGGAGPATPGPPDSSQPSKEPSCLSSTRAPGRC